MKIQTNHQESTQVNIAGNKSLNTLGNDAENVQMPSQDIDTLVAILDGYVQAGGSRLKMNVVEGNGEVISHSYHHGRCDVGSPWARGEAFDVLEEEKD